MTRHTLCVFLLVGAASAQLDTNGPNAALSVNGTTASFVDPIDHDVAAPVPNPLALRVETGATPAGIMLLSSTLPLSTGNTFATPWGGSIDVGAPGPSGIVVLADGIGGTGGTFQLMPTSAVPAGGGTAAWELGINIPSVAAGFRTAVQGVVTDATQPPFFLDNTEAADIEFFSGASTVVGPSSFSTYVPFALGRTFSFHGGVYSGVWVGTGFVQFDDVDAIPTDAATTESPTIAACATDWSPSAVVVEQAGNAVVVEWGRSGVGTLSHALAFDSNRLRVVLELDDPAAPNAAAGAFAVYLDELDPAEPIDSGRGLMGHYPGTSPTAAGAIAQAANGESSLAAPSASAAGAGHFEEHLRGTTTPGMFGYDGAGSRRYLNDLTEWSGGGVLFTPMASATAIGAAGYASTPVDSPGDQLQLLLDPVIDGAGDTITLVGRFFGFDDPMNPGTVVVTSRGAGVPATATATVVGVLDGSGVAGSAIAYDDTTAPLRNGEGLVLTVPPLPGGPVDVTVNFASGLTASLPAYVAPAGAIRTAHTIGFSGFAQHVLGAGVTIDYGGVTYTDVFISSRGFVTFGAAPAVFFGPELIALFNGFPSTAGGGTAGAPGVAIAMNSQYRYFAESKVEVIEDPSTNVVRVSFGNVYHHLDDLAGTFAATFGTVPPRSVEFDHAGYLPRLQPFGGANTTVGVSDGSPTGTDVDASMIGGLAGLVSTYIGSSSASIGQSFSGDSPLGLETVNGTGVWTALDVGAAVPFTWILL